MRTGTYSRPRSTIFVLLMPLLVAACALGAATMLAQALVSRERQQLRGRTDAEAKYVAAQLRSAVLQSMDVLPRIGNWWLSQGRPEAREDWETDAQLFLQAGTGLRELVWIDTNKTPLAGCGPCGYRPAGTTERRAHAFQRCQSERRASFLCLCSDPIGAACRLCSGTV